MRQNDPSSIPDRSTILDQAVSARARALAWNGLLVVLLVVTSFAVATVSAWLVLPYLALMAVILITPPGRREREDDPAGESRTRTGSDQGAKSVGDRARSEAGDDGGAARRALSDPSAGSDTADATTTDPEPAARPAKARRGKGRGRKAKAVDSPPAATTTAIWIQVGPGKFVRAEAPGPAVAPPFSSPSVPENEGEPSGVLTPSSGTVEEPADSPLPADRDDDKADAAQAAEAPSAPVGGLEAWADPTSIEPTVVEPASVPVTDEGNLAPGPGPESGPFDASATLEAIDAALDAPQGAPPYVNDPTDFYASLSGFGEQPAGLSTLPQGDHGEAEAVLTTAEDSSEPVGGSEAEREDGAAPGGPIVDEADPLPLGGDPGYAGDVAFAAEPTGAIVLESYPDVSPCAGVGDGASMSPGSVVVEVEDEPAGESARDAGGPGLDQVEDVVDTGADLAASRELEAGPESDAGFDRHRQGDEAGDNGIAPDAFAEMTWDNGIAPDALVDVPPAAIETVDEPAEPEASPRDQVEDAVASEPAAPLRRSARPGAFRLPGPARGNRPRGDLATRWRSGPGVPSSGRVVRSGRRDRVTPVPRRPRRWTAARSRFACRTFPPRSPPASSARP